MTRLLEISKTNSNESGPDTDTLDVEFGEITESQKKRWAHVYKIDNQNSSNSFQTIPNDQVSNTNLHSHLVNQTHNIKQSQISALKKSQRLRKAVRQVFKRIGDEAEEMHEAVKRSVKLVLSRNVKGGKKLRD